MSLNSLHQSFLSHLNSIFLLGKIRPMTLEKFLQILFSIGSRYYLVAGIYFLIFYVLFRKGFSSKKIQAAYPKLNDYLREIGYSLGTIILFAAVPIFIVQNPAVRPYTTLYDRMDGMGWGYYWFAYLLMFLMHDTYFYWAHRIMHHPSIFKWVHKVHHLSTNPSPWAAYAFHPLESIVETGVFVLFVFTIPIHQSHLFLFFFFSIIYNAYGHLGWELYPAGFSKSWIGKWINTSVSHNQHHKYFKGNYGLYLLFWDRVMGTLREDYDSAFEKVKQKQ